MKFFYFFFFQTLCIYRGVHHTTCCNGTAHRGENIVVGIFGRHSGQSGAIRNAHGQMLRNSINKNPRTSRTVRFSRALTRRAFPPRDRMEWKYETRE